MGVLGRWKREGGCGVLGFMDRGRRGGGALEGEFGWMLGGFAQGHGNGRRYDLMRGIGNVCASEAAGTMCGMLVCAMAPG